MKSYNLGLLPRLIIAIILGILIGQFTPAPVVRILATFNSIFGNFLGFVIPLIIVGFVAPGIAELGTGAGKLLGITTAIAYLSTLISGFFAFGVSTTLLPRIIQVNSQFAATNPEEALLKPFFTVDMPPLFGVMSALVIAFILGIGMAALKEKTMYNFMSEFQKIVQMIITKVIIPLLPVHIAGIFANMTHAGEVARILSVFGKVFVIVIASHITIILLQFLVASLYSGKNMIMALKNQIPGYLTAIGTQSSAATIPVNLECARNNGVSEGIREFVIPLCATIHLSGSTITLTTCAIAVMMLNGMPVTLAKLAGFIMMLGVTMVAAPGVPGGAVMAALGILQSMLGFTEAQLALMIALYLTQDSFGTACNVSGDNAIAIIVDKIAQRMKLNAA
ncbi:dicarboxylate/amino acid:cation symporter [Thermosediminibacter litoriperuensis]|uniref:Na+/H+-dicarboxylate symporter n=1 Tax=Thermosediminibacter litoriperuensis TaxID=291989 RepID=A0A5S5AMT3_9FIRM|nr:dicarboxylate/amino acid:cation symporter [Thermosediminibacter litoriperuensis]TYP51579.1 Na+/H+-dicarboxylate symporter [Thermosediminibacter litoriperuensis]